VTWRVNEADAVGAILQKLAARLLRLQDALLALDPEVVLDSAAIRNQLHERCRDVRVELVGDEDPARFGIGVDGPVDVGNKVRFGPSGPDGWPDDLASRDVEVCYQAQRPMSDVLKLDPLDEAGPYRLCFMDPLERLHAGLLVRADHVRALFSELSGVLIRFAEPLDVCLVLLGSFALVLRRQPVLALVRSKLRLAKKRSTCLGEMLSTMPRLIAS